MVEVHTSQRRRRGASYPSCRARKPRFIFFKLEGNNNRFPNARQGPPAPLLIAPYHKSHLQPLPRVLPALVPWVMDDLPFPWLWQCVTVPLRLRRGEVPHPAQRIPHFGRLWAQLGPLSWDPSHPRANLHDLVCVQIGMHVPQNEALAGCISQMPGLDPGTNQSAFS